VKALITDYEFPNIDNEKRVFAEAGIELVVAQCKTPQQVIAAAQDAEALIVQWAPMTREVMAALPKCKIIVRYGIGMDNIDIKAATDHGIAACNVPDYASGEVADHALALALTLARQTAAIDRRLRDGTWKITPDLPMPSFRDMRFVTLGCGRIAREVLLRAKGFGFALAAYDPFISPEAMTEIGVSKIGLEEALATADILSLHLPLNAETRHLLNTKTLRAMKKTAIVINTARGGLIDTLALAAELTEGTILGAGIDVYETEPLPLDHPLRKAPRALLTSHIAWFSDASAPRLQRMVAEEAIRGLRGEPLRGQVNPRV
jgi:D-3-phosphoglycerate dehydrogenase